MDLVKVLYDLRKCTISFYLKLWKYTKNLIFKRNSYHPFFAYIIMSWKYITLLCNATGCNMSHVNAKAVTRVIVYLKQLFWGDKDFL